MVTYDDLEETYRKAAAGTMEPDCILGSWRWVKQFLSPEECKIIEDFVSSHPGVGWAFNRKTREIEEAE